MLAGGELFASLYTWAPRTGCLGRGGWSSFTWDLDYYLDYVASPCQHPKITFQGRSERLFSDACC